MMSLLVFLVILFGVFGVITTQYINQCRYVYSLWVDEIVYGQKVDPNKKEKRDCVICSKVEALSRDFCIMNKIIVIIVIMIYLTLAIAFIAFRKTLQLQNIHILTLFSDFASLGPENQKDAVINIASLFLTILIFGAIPVLMYFLKFFCTPKWLRRISCKIKKYILFFKKNSNSEESSASSDCKKQKHTIDEKLFELWYKFECFNTKNEKYRLKLQPRRLYNTFAKESASQAEIYGEKIKIPEDLEKIMRQKKILKEKKLSPFAQIYTKLTSILSKKIFRQFK